MSYFRNSITFLLFLVLEAALKKSIEIIKDIFFGAASLFFIGVVIFLFLLDSIMEWSISQSFWSKRKMERGSGG
jgi:hypothetical protein